MAGKNVRKSGDGEEKKPSSNEVVWYKPGDAVPKVLDPDVTMEIVQRYVDTERNRSRKVLLWISSFFLFVVLLILVVFLSIGMIVLRSSKSTVDLVENIRAEAAVYETRVMGISDKISRVERDSKETAGIVSKANRQRNDENEMFKKNLERFSQWISEGNNQKVRLITAMESRLKEVEEANRRQLDEFEKLRGQYMELVKSAGPRVETASVVPVAPGPAAVNLQQPVPDLIRRPDQSIPIPAVSKGPDTADVPVAPEPGSQGVEPPAEISEPVRNPMQSPEQVSTVTFPNGDKYKGTFKNGLFHGWGVYTYRNGEVYEGDFMSDMKHGNGSFLYANGDKYNGEFRNDMRHGMGTMTFANGERYTGEFRGDVIDGKGSWVYNNGNKYSGDFQNGLRHGNGELRFENGDIYRGEFVQDRRTGQGNYMFSDGSKYIGEFNNGKRHGAGRYIYPGGEEYIGSFKDGMKDGPGECIYPNGSKIKGLWQKDKLIKSTDE